MPQKLQSKIVLPLIFGEGLTLFYETKTIDQSHAQLYGEESFPGFLYLQYQESWINRFPKWKIDEYLGQGSA